MPETKYQRLIRLLKEMFQLGDAAELDFGIYRIMHARKAEIEKFLDQELFQKHVKEALAGEAGGKRAELETQIADLEKTLKAAGVDPKSSTKYQELVAQREAAPDQTALEDQVYSHLLTFFGRYYQEGDFISQRRYGENAYAIPYNGEEVKLYWANHDQYYIKSSEDLKHYAFLVGPENARKRVRFKLVAASTERDNAKEQKGKERYHIFARGENSIAEEKTEAGTELVIPFEYRVVTREEVAEHQPDIGARPNMRDELSALSARWILESARLPQAWKPMLEAAHSRDGEATGKSIIEHHIRRYMAKATFDYFIHKDLGGFLRRELDWYIKHELLKLEDILDGKQTPEQLSTRHFAKLRVLRAIAEKLIDFLAQIENFQKKLWLKKKFVLETHYLIRLGIIPEEFYPEIAANDAQREEWVQLCAINKIKKSAAGPGYSQPLTTAFLKALPSLVVDSRNFPGDWRTRVLAAIGKLDATQDGVLVRSENSHAIRLLSAAYQRRIELVHIDPPYNTSTSGFLYRNTYEHSSWLAMMIERLQGVLPMLAENASMLCHIDENEYERLQLACDLVGLPNGGTIIWDKKNPMLGRKGVATQHEYVLWRTFIDAPVYLRSANYREMMRKAGELVDKFGGVNDRSRTEFAKWVSSHQTLTGGEKAYRYIDKDGHVYRGVAMGAPEPRSDPKFHIPLIHPKTKRKCPVPPNGWSRAPETLAALLEADEILFGEDETTQPQKKVKLGAESQRQVSSVIQDTGRGKSDLDQYGLDFPYCHPRSLYVELVGAGAPSENAVVFDFFAGSGTNGDAVIFLNRDDGWSRKFILVEVGEQFNSVLIPRLKKATYSPEWSDGAPVRPASKEETQRGPSIMKVLVLESYEDACDGIRTDGRDTPQQKAFDKLPEAEREKYRLHYMLNVESRGSASLLNIQKFERPFGYTLRVTRDDVTREQAVDLVETFNWLLGLHVDTIRVSRDATFKPGDHGILEVTGKDPQGNRCLVLWRNVDEVPDDKLIRWFEKNRYKVKDFEWDLIYVNGDNTLENLKRDDQTWTVRLTEQEFHRLMFEGTE